MGCCQSGLVDTRGIGDVVAGVGSRLVRGIDGRRSSHPHIGANASQWNSHVLLPSFRHAKASTPVPSKENVTWFTSLASDLGSMRSEEHTSELQSRENLVCRLL